MTYESPVTYDLALFGSRERSMAADLLAEPTPSGAGSGLRIGFNRQSANVWLEDEDLNVWMMNGDDLEMHLFTPHDGHEGFISDLLEEIDDTWNSEDVEYVHDMNNHYG